jgi:hypothetical protein
MILLSGSFDRFSEDALYKEPWPYLWGLSIILWPITSCNTLKRVEIISANAKQA